MDFRRLIIIPILFFVCSVNAQVDLRQLIPDSTQYMVPVTDSLIAGEYYQKYLKLADTMYFAKDDSTCFVLFEDGDTICLPGVEGAASADTYIDTGFFQNDTIIFWRVDSALNVIDSFKVALPAGAADTDDQQVDNFSITGNTITLEIQDDGQAPHTLDIPPGSDDQAISITGHVITLEDGGSVNLPDTVDPNTDDQLISISNDTVTLEDGGFVVLPDQPDSITAYNGLSNQTPDSVKLGGVLVENTRIVGTNPTTGFHHAFQMDSIGYGRINVENQFLIKALRDTNEVNENSLGGLTVNNQNAVISMTDFDSEIYTDIKALRSGVIMVVDSFGSGPVYGSLEIDTTGSYMLPSGQSEDIYAGMVLATTDSASGKFEWKYLDSLDVPPDSLYVNGDSIGIIGSNAVLLPSESDADFWETGTVTPPDTITDDQYTFGNTGFGIEDPETIVHIHNEDDLPNITPLKISTSTIGSAFIQFENDDLEQWETGMFSAGTYIIYDRTNDHQGLIINQDSDAAIEIGAGLGMTDPEKTIVFRGYGSGENYESTPTYVAAFDANENVLELPIDSVWNSAAGTIPGDSVDFAFSPKRIIYADSDSSMTTNSASADSIVMKMAGTNMLRLTTTNIGLGATALNGSATGFANFGLGLNSLRNLTSGNFNTSIGAFSTQDLTTGSNNVSIGSYSGLSLGSGQNNTFVGTNAGYSNDGDRNVFLGTSAGSNETGDDQLYIDNSSTSSPLIYGDFSLDELKINGSNWVVDERLDSDGDAGTSSQILSSTGTGTNWINQAAAQTLSISGDDLSISGGNTIDISGVDTDTDDQTLSYSAGNLTISDGNTIDISGVDTDTDDQDLTLSGTDLSIEDGNTVDLASIDTDDQTLSISGNDLTIVDGNTVTLPAVDDQTLSISGSILSIEDGNSVTLPSTGGGGGATSITSDSIVWNTLDNAHHVMFTDSDDEPSTDDSWSSLVLYNDTTRYMHVAETQFFLGYEAGGSSFLGWNAVVGPSALAESTGSRFTAALGYNVLRRNTSINNTAVGASAGARKLGGSNNTLVGFEAGEGAEGAAYTGNTLIGAQAGQGMGSYNYNTYVGYRTGMTADGSNNISIGREALRLAGAINRDIMIGFRSGYNLASIGYNVSIGDESMRNAGDGTAYRNIYLGRSSGYDSDGDNNVGIGTAAGYINDGDNNVFVGNNVGRYNATGDGSTAVGSFAIYNNVSDSITALGANAGYANTSGERNTFLGTSAGHKNTIGSDNIFIGYNSGRFDEYQTNNNLIVIDPNYALTTQAGEELIWGDAGEDSLVVNNVLNAPVRLESGALVKVTDEELHVLSFADNFTEPTGDESKITIPDAIKWGDYTLALNVVYESHIDSSVNNIQIYVEVSEGSTSFTDAAASITGTERMIDRIQFGAMGPLNRPTMQLRHKNGYPADARMTITGFRVRGDKLLPKEWTENWIYQLSQVVGNQITLNDDYFENSDGAYAGWHILADNGTSDLIEENDSVHFVPGNVMEIDYDDATGEITFDHEDVSTLTNVNNSGDTYIQDVYTDGYGHVTSLSSTAVDVYDGWDIFVDGVFQKTIEDLDNVNFVDGTLTTARTVTVTGNAVAMAYDHNDVSSFSSSNNTGNVFIQDIFSDGLGHITSVGTAAASSGAMDDWRLEATTPGSGTTVSDGETVKFVAGSGISVSRSFVGGENHITITASGGGGDGDGMYDGTGTIPSGTVATASGSMGFYDSGTSFIFYNGSELNLRSPGSSKVVVSDLLYADQFYGNSTGTVFGNNATHERLQFSSTSALVYIDNGVQLSIFADEFRVADHLSTNGASHNTSYGINVGGGARKTTGSDVWDSFSDKRIKDNIEYLDGKDALSRFAKLRPAKFRYQDWYADKFNTDREEEFYSYIAQDVREVFPEAVEETEDLLPNGEKILALKSGILSMNHRAATIQLIKENVDLKSRVKKLELLVNKLIEK